jgi:hypothetical protein
MRATYAYIKLQAEIAYVKLQATVEYVKLSAAISYVLLKATAVTGYFLKLLDLFDTARASDTAVKTVGKGLTDVAQASETLARSFGKPLTDSANPVDVAAITVGKTASDTATPSDAAVLGINKTLNDTVYATDDVDGIVTDDDQIIQFVKVLSEVVTPTETLVIANGFNREFVESAVSGDVAAKTFIKNLIDTVNVTDVADVSNAKVENPSDGSSVSDQAVIGFGKALTESPTAADAAFVEFMKGLADVPTATDSAVIEAGKALIDSTSASDAGTLISQGYCDITYFAEDYVGTSRTF